MKASVNARTRQRKAPLRGATSALRRTPCDAVAPGDGRIGKVDVGFRPSVRITVFTGDVTGN